VTTILDVAHRAGVSMKTVSRVLNNEAHVSARVREQVEAAVAALGYRPNRAARQLAGQKSFIIAYPFNNPSATYITNVLMGAAVACRDRGYHLASEPVDLDGTMFEVLDRLIDTLNPDGMILTPPLCDMPEVVGHVASLGMPLVRIAGGGDLHGRAIRLDERSISLEMTRHLVEQGHRRIGFIRPHPGHASSQSRYDGYLDGLAEAGIAPDAQLVRPGLFDIASGAQAAHALLDLPAPPSAIFAANDEMALGALQVAHARGLAIPGDVAIAGFDDSPASQVVYPALTTIRQPTVGLGAAAAAMLLGETPDLSALRLELVIRASTLRDQV